MRTILILIPLLVLVLGLKAQNQGGTPSFYASFRSYFSGGEELPFWFRANQNGTFPVGSNATQLLRTGFYRNMERDADKPWDYCMGADLVGGYAGEAYFQPNQYWVGVRYRWLVLKAGAMADSIRFGGLSSTNGDLDGSNNARPVPNISLSSNGYVPLPFVPVVSWKALYSEGVLWDNGYIQNARLHHKNLYFKVDLPQKWHFSAGLEHYVFWGGGSPTQGRITVGKEYAYFVSGIKIGKSGGSAEEVNLTENHLGIYNVEVSKQWRNNHLTFYWNHPFENRAGLEMANAQDGLWGLHWKRTAAPQYLTELVYEWMNTFDQGHDGVSGSDDYFNDAIYRSGYTHFAQTMSSPLFVPTLDGEGASTGYQNNCIRMHHLGLKGYLLKSLGWRTLLTYTQNRGTYAAAFPGTVGECSFLGEFTYPHPHLPLQLTAAVAGDFGELFENRVGVALGVKWEPKDEPGNRRRAWVIRKRR